MRSVGREGLRLAIAAAVNGIEVSFLFEAMRRDPLACAETWLYVSTLATSLRSMRQESSVSEELLHIRAGWIGLGTLTDFESESAIKLWSSRPATSAENCNLIARVAALSLLLAATIFPHLLQRAVQVFLVAFAAVLGILRSVKSCALWIH